ncbi:Pleckstrin homology domain-containing protein [Neohortaea acidophila]|uniref:Pleckstrin homology domain-containing protein n=1 Tax=Neohortaea acidophila TaxID=245834 RepID=A0A6A6PF24_9PEZI|nr:Pleckstrin homology domain-containing protein [Neohortaea acidophila]KAF2478540.1 Pleckstrin homology domain-containing protein [Neohortaea acidophila]
MATATNGDVTATDNVMNTVADASSSLFQICVTLRQRLQGVPGFSESLLEEEEDADDDTDPVTLLWRTFRRGYPLMLLYNALRPDQPLSMPANVREEKKGKACTFKFIQACITDLKFAQEDCFIITDLYGDDTTGFVKVARVVNRVLDILVQRGIVDDIQPTASDFEQAEKGMKRTQRQHIVSELVSTERTYVQHLELLQAFKHLVEEKGLVPGDAVHDIFLNLNALLDFQRRFLIRVEQTNHLAEEEQNWGKLFVLYCEAFKVYEPYIANQRKCERTVVANFDKLALTTMHASIEMRQLVESPTNLYGFLMKPFQRLSKYPLLLDDLYKKGDLDEERRQDLLIGKEASTSVLARTNHAVDKEEKIETVQELKLRVEDWKGHKVDSFGALLLYGTFTVLKSENLGVGGKDGERQYHVYLFETILLCCKDIDLSKPKNKLSNRQLVDKRGKPKLQLKGRIFMQNVTDLVSLGKPGSYTCQIFWKGDPSIENFIIRFTTEEMMKRWANQIEIQRRKWRDRSGRNSEGNRSLGTSTTEFEFMRNQPAMENPYAQFGQEEDEDDAETLVGSGHTSATAVGSVGGFSTLQDLGSGSRNPSFTSLRSRGESISSNAGRAQPARYGQGMHQPSLSLRTRELQQLAAQAEVGSQPESYFSPVDGSPSTLSSSRTSASSGMYSSFPMPGSQPMRQFEDGPYPPPAHSARYTAPAMARQREPSTSGPTPPPLGRVPPPRPGMHSVASGAPRNRSVSSPDIHNQPRGPPPGAVPQPPVPHMPAPYQYNPTLVPRSQNNSPSLGNGLPPPPRGQNASPQVPRERVSSGQQQYQHRESRNATPTPGGMYPPPQHPSPQQHLPPPPPPPSSTFHKPQSSFSAPNEGQQGPTPTQLKVKVHCPSVSQSLTLVVPLNISYQSLVDRIDAKLQRSTNLSLSERGLQAGAQLVKLKFLDEEDYVSIQSDEDVQTAFEAWEANAMGSGMAEVNLFVQG